MMGTKTPAARAVVDGMHSASTSSARASAYARPREERPRPQMQMSATRAPRLVTSTPCGGFEGPRAAAAAAAVAAAAARVQRRGRAWRDASAGVAGAAGVWQAQTIAPLKKRGLSRPRAFAKKKAAMISQMVSLPNAENACL
jgi:hypothetical protein